MSSSKSQASKPSSEANLYAELMRSSRKRLLDLSLRNRLLNYGPADPEHHDDGRAHKFLKVCGRFEAVWERLVAEDKQLRVSYFKPAELRDEQKKLAEELRRGSRSESPAILERIAEIARELADGEREAAEGHVWVEKLSEEAYQKRLRRLRDEAKSLEDSTGDSAFFLACGFLKWPEKPKSSRSSVDPAVDGVSTFRYAPLVLVKASITDAGKGSPGRKQFRIIREEDPQDNQSLKAKLQEEWNFNLPDLADDTSAREYLAVVARAIVTSKLKGFEVQETLALGFFNFARYRLWLDLDPRQWETAAPESHPIVRSILTVAPLDTACPRVIDATRDEEIANEVAKHQETDDIPIIRDADASQYSALLYARKGKSLVIIGPPGSGKSQTITNLVGTMLASGRRVLFVAQKLPALDVVARRVREAGLGEFCLQFYSARAEGEPDRTPVTPRQIHAQLSSARHMLGGKRSASSLDRRAPALAKKLNAYTCTLHGIHPVYGETLQSILCAGVKLKEDAEIAWGTEWGDELMDITLPAGVAISPEWMDPRVRLLTELARLQHEAGDFWHGWDAVKLTVLDVNNFEAVIRRHRVALHQLSEWCQTVSPTLLDWNQARLYELADGAAKLKLPSNCSDEFVRSLADKGILRDAHQFEQELKSAESDESSARLYLDLLPEGAGDTAHLVLTHLSEIERSVPSNAAFGKAREALNLLRTFVQTTDVLIAIIGTHPDGVAALVGSSDSAPSLGAVFALAKMEAEPLPRAPGLLLPLLARAIIDRPTLAEEAQLISEKAEQLLKNKEAIASKFSQVRRAEEVLSSEFAKRLKEAIAAGLGSTVVGRTPEVEAPARALAAAFTQLYSFPQDLLFACTEVGGVLTNRRIRELAGFVEKMSPADFELPVAIDSRLIRAWANGEVSEGDARAEVAAYERAMARKMELIGLIGAVEPTEQMKDQFRRSVEAAEELGLGDLTIGEIKALEFEISRLEASITAIVPTLERLGFAADIGSFRAVKVAAKLASLVAHAPDLSGVQLECLKDVKISRRILAAVDRVAELRRNLAPGAFKVLTDAAALIRACVQAAVTAEESAGSPLGFRRPSSLRDFRSIGAAIPILRSMPPLPIGCDMELLSGEQYRSTIKYLASAAEALQRRITLLPAGTDYHSLGTSSEARKNLSTYRAERSSLTRFFRGEWRRARAAIVGFAPTLPFDQAVAAYEAASEIRADEELFAGDPSGTAVLGSYFRGLKTDWRPFIAFADASEALSRALDGFERNERIIAAWRSESGGIHAIAHACGQLDVVAAQCKAAHPDLFGTTEGPFRQDSSISAARERAADILGRIDAILNSPKLALRQFSSVNAPESGTVTGIVETASRAENEIEDLVALTQETLGAQFIGRPEDWAVAKEIATWALRIHEGAEFETLREAALDLCFYKPHEVVLFAQSSQAAAVSLDLIRESLIRSRIRPDGQADVALFYREVRARLSVIFEGAKLLLGKPNDGLGAMRLAEGGISEFLREFKRSERVRLVSSFRPFSAQASLRSLDWVRELTEKGLPAKLVALTAESGSSMEVRCFLLQCVSSCQALAVAKQVGCVASRWLEDDASARHVAEWGTSLAEALSSTRLIAAECGAAPEITLSEFHRGALAVLAQVQLRTEESTWMEVLGFNLFANEDPVQAIRQTILWLRSLQAANLPKSVLAWVLLDRPDEKIEWWSSLILQSRIWRSERTAMRQSSLPEWDDRRALGEWRAELGARYASLSLAIEQVGRVAHNNDATLAVLRVAANALRSAAETRSKAEAIRARLPGASNLDSASAVRDHRSYARWIGDQPSVISNWARVGSSADIFAHISKLGPALEAKVDTWQRLLEFMESFGTLVDGGPSGMLSEDQKIYQARDRVDAAIANLHRLASWGALQRESNRAVKLGVDRIAAQARRRRASPEKVEVAFRAAVAWQKSLVVWKENPGLQQFRSSKHEDLRAEFAKVEAMAVSEQNRERIVSALRKSTDGGMASWGSGSAEQLLLSESSKTKRMMPVRKLVEVAGERMQELCPCWLATPAAIAQFMPPGRATFDLVIMDEASQLTPEDSWGAIARGSQVVVVGDPKQMPPSNFFEHTVADDEEDQEMEGDVASDQARSPFLKGHQHESVLKAAQASLPQVWLNWHYRSLHERLIAAANVLSYDNRLVLFPSSHVKHRHLGIRLCYVPSGTATTGQVRNPNEAAALVESLVLIAEEFASPNYRHKKGGPHTVGVIAMNIHQQEVIKDLIDLRKNSDPVFARNLAVLESHETEPLFVRNLENVQGDERDVVLISTTYGPNTVGGTPTQRFFPINQEGGERRFNVLITRAKWRMEVFTSLRSEQLTSAQVGVQHMRSFLTYCETNIVPRNGRESGRSFDSPFEAHVYAVLEAKGYSVAKQVGVAGYFLDLAIRDPRLPDRYVLGIECDGATYHSSRAARDRDRLRENVLSERGWKIHRIWSTEWFYNNAAVRKDLFEAIDAAIARQA
jgi:very-short-patch-repair endonuclease